MTTRIRHIASRREPSHAVSNAPRNSSYARTFWLAATLSFAYWWLWRGGPDHWWAIDGYPTLIASRLWFEGHWQFIYHDELWPRAFGNPEWKRHLLELKIISGGTGFVYHPLYLFALAPLIGWMNYDAFIVVWNIICALSFGLVFAESARIAQLDDRENRTLFVLFACASFPALYAASLGQNIVPALALLLAANHLAERGSWSAWPVLALAIAAKVWILPIAALMFAIQFARGKKCFAACGAVILIVLLIGVPWLTAPELFSRYIKIAGNLSETSMFAYNNVSLRALISRLIDMNWISESHRWIPRVAPREIKTLELLVIAPVFLLLVLIALRRRPPFRAQFVAACAFSTLLPGISWTHYFVMIMPAIIYLYGSGSKVLRLAALPLMFILALPWHNLHGEKNLWPNASQVLLHPTLYAVIFATPLVLALLTTLLTIIARDRRPEHSGQLTLPVPMTEKPSQP